MTRTWVPLSEAVKGNAAAEWVEWIEVERQNGVRCLRCLKRFETAHLIPVNCRECWDQLFADGHEDQPCGVHPTMAPEDEVRA